MKTSHVRVAALAAVAAAAIAAPALAVHSWGGYHWKKTGSQATPPVVTSITDSLWGSYVDKAVADWNQSSVIESPYDDETNSAVTTNPRTCRAQSGKILVCNTKYGQNGWLGIASIWLSNGHISQGTTKLNDTYFSMPGYNTPHWRALVACQEIGHDYGLGHQDENFNTDNTTSCMDYTNQPAGNGQPDSHDYQQLQSIYNHTESNFAALSPNSSPASAPSLNGASAGDSPAEWGRPVRSDAQGRPNLYVQDLGKGRMKVTHVLWAIGEGPRGRVHNEDEHDDGHTH